MHGADKKRKSNNDSDSDSNRALSPSPPQAPKSYIPRSMSNPKIFKVRHFMLNKNENPESFNFEASTLHGKP